MLTSRQTAYYENCNTSDCCMPADLREACGGADLPHPMTELLLLLETHGPAFAAKPVVTVIGAEDRELVYQVKCPPGLLKCMTPVRKERIQVCARHHQSRRC